MQTLTPSRHGLQPLPQGRKLLPRRRPLLFDAVLLLCLLFASNCGGSGGSSGGVGSPPANPDFSLSVPANASVQQGSFTMVNISVVAIDGFSAQVNITISGIPTGVSATPSQFTLSPGGQQQVMLSAYATASVGTPTLEVTGVSGVLMHMMPISFSITAAATGAAATARDRYVETDIQWDTGFLQYFPQRLIIFEPATKRFFVSNTSLNRVDVIDATTEKKIAEIPVPGAFVGDESLDQSTIYLGTEVGDLYEIDPVGMTVKARIPSVQIGPAGFPTYQVRVLSDGQLALLGNQGGIPEVDGWATLGIWNPATNALETYGSMYGNLEAPTNNPPICGTMENIAQWAVTADRTKILMSSHASDGTLCLFDPVTLEQHIVGANDSGPIFVPPDGQEIVIATGDQITVYDSSTLQQIDQSTVNETTPGGPGYALSQDGNTLYGINQLQGQGNPAYNWRTHQITGWLTTFDIYDNPFATVPVPLAVDSTGLIACALGHGVEFTDGAALQANPPSIFLFAYNNVLQPTFGPVQGGNQVVVTNVDVTNILDFLFGSQPATVDSNGPTGTTVTPPSGSPGPVDVSMNAQNGSFLFLPQAYSYGPSIVEVRPDMSTADGGGTGTAFGYGFGSAAFNGTAPGLQVTVAGQSAQVTQYLSQPYSQTELGYPFPLEAVQYTLPAGTSATGANVAISDSAGSVTASQAITYLPATQQFPLPGSQLTQGIYDSKRDVYYFTDQHVVRVFSRTMGMWLSPITIAGASQLWGISLSPDGSNLAVSDAASNVIYLLDPDTPNAVSTFPLLNAGSDEFEQPIGLAVTDSGQVYFVTFNLSIIGGSGLHQLDTTTGAVTDFSNVEDDSLGADAFMKVLLTNDNSRIYVNDAGAVFEMDTATNTFSFNPILFGSDYELTLASNNTWMSATEFLMDTNLNPESTLAYVDRDIWNVSAVYGEKLSPDGNLLFLPLTNGIDVVDGKLGTLLHRVALPFALSPNYDALVADGQDNVLIAITGQTGDGIAVIDLTSLAEPAPSNAAAEARFDLLPFKKSADLAGAKALKAEKSSAPAHAKPPSTPPHISASLAVRSPR